MKTILVMFVLLSTSYVFADSSQNELAALRDNPCVTGRKDRFKTVTGLYDRKPTQGTEHIGVTSHGDVAVLKNNNLLIIYACYRGSGVTLGHPTGDFVLEDSGINCSSGEILSYTLRATEGYGFNFRSPRFSESDSLCFNSKMSVNGSDRDAQKDAVSSSSTTVRSSFVSQE